LEFGEPVYFFPLGSVYAEGEARIEIQLQLHPYTPAAPSETETPPLDSDSSVLSPELKSTGPESVP
jgi:hypothetical protein